MHRAKRFGKPMICLLICVFTLLSSLTPVSAAMVDLELIREERQVCEVYYSASEKATVIGCLTDGTELTVTGEKKDFYKITCAGMRGYISKDSVLVDDNGIYYVNCGDTQSTRAMEGLTDEEHTAAIEQVLSLAARHLGTPYRYGGTRPGGFDCSGFVMYVYGKAGFSLNRKASAQLENGVMVAYEDLLPGDLVFFQGTGSGAISSHVGIYVGGGEFIHASSSGIQYDRLDSAYWSGHYLTARRIVLTGTAVYGGAETNAVKTNRSSDIPVGAFLRLLQLQVQPCTAIINWIDKK